MRLVKAKYLYIKILTVSLSLCGGWGGRGGYSRHIIRLIICLEAVCQKDNGKIKLPNLFLVVTESKLGKVSALVFKGNEYDIIAYAKEKIYVQIYSW